MNDLNNFHGYFPGGFRWELKKTGEYPIFHNEDRIMSDISLLIDTLSVDTNSLIRERELWSRKVDEAITIYKNNPDMIKQLKIEVAQHQRKVHEIIYPVYEEMLKKGYTERELTS